jgi:hypothetical protein
VSEQKLNQVLAIEKGAKGRAESTIKVSYQQCGHTDRFTGMSRTYTPFQADDLEYPAETKNVQFRVGDVLEEARKIMSDLWDVTATKDFANCNAKADIVVDGETLVTGVPATYLLFMEKQILNLRALVAKLPILDEAVQWTWDENSHLFRSQVQKNHKTKKVQRAITLVQQDEHHPGQAQLITEDVAVGTYETVQLSGAIPVKQKKAIFDRLEKLARAVKQARERANMVEAPDLNPSAKLFQFILGS